MKLIFSADRLPEVDETDAFWSRTVLIRFPYRFERNDEFKKQLFKDEELSALLNICLNALDRLWKKHFETEDVEKVVKVWKLSADPLSVFIEEREAKSSPRQRTKKSRTIYMSSRPTFSTRLRNSARRKKSKHPLMTLASS